MSPRHRSTHGTSLAALPPSLRSVAGGAAVVGLAGLALAGAAWTRPAQTTDAAATAATTMGFSYTTQVPPSAAYDGTTVTAPQPVFRALTDEVEVSYDYAGPPGTLSVRAQLSTDSGWSATVPLAGDTAIGARHEGSVHLDLSSLQQRADDAAAVTGIPAEGLLVAVVPTVALDGGGEFAPRFELALDDLTLTATSALTAEGVSSTSGTRVEPARLSALGHHLDVAAARAVGPVAVVLAMLAMLIVITLVRRSAPVAERERIRRRYGALILPVLPIALAAGRPVVDVPDVDALARLAERYGLLVLAWSRGGVDTYVVQDEGATYRYRSGSCAPQQVLPVPEPARQSSGVTQVWPCGD